MIGSRRLGFRNFEKDADRLDTEIFSGDLPPGPIGTAAWNHIHLIPPGGATVTSYPVTVAGLLAALAAATVAGSMIWIPPGTFNTAITIPANIALVALGEKVAINGQWTLNSGVVVANIVQTQSSSSAGALSGVVGPSSGIAYMKNCSITVENTGASDAYAVNQSGAGELWLWACATYGNASGGGAGYGARQSAGTLYVSDDGRHRGSTGKFSGEITLFSFDDVIKLKTSTFTKLYNATEAGVTAAITAASANEVLTFPKSIAIPVTSGVTLNKAVFVYDMNLAASGFAGAALTISAGAHLFDPYIRHNGTGQASAIGVDITAACKIWQGDIGALSATSINIGIRATGTATYSRAHLIDCIGDARNGATNVGIRLLDYSLAQNCLGFAKDGSVENVGIEFQASNTGEDGAMAVACSGAAVGTLSKGGLVETNLNGRIIGGTYKATVTDLVVRSGATLEVNGVFWGTTSVDAAATLTYLEGDRVPLRNYYTDESETVTISAGVLSADHLFTIVAAETGTSDDLDTINFGTAAKFLVLQADTGDTISVKHGTGNINLNGATDFSLSGEETLLLWFDGTNWADVGAGGAAATTADDVFPLLMSGWA